FSKSKMAWTVLDYEPAAPERLDGKVMPGGLDAMGQIMKFLGSLLGAKPNPEVAPRGFLGIEVADGAKGVTVKSVLAKGPAGPAGLKAGDRLPPVGGRTPPAGRAVGEGEDGDRCLGKFRPGQKVPITVGRGSGTQDITVKVGEGL